MPPGSAVPRDELLIQATGYRDLLVGYAYGYLRDWGDAEDSVQEALLVVSRRAEDYDRTRSLFSWVRGILRLRCLERLRVKQKELPMEIGELEALLQRHLDDAWEESLKDDLGRRIGALRECMSRLPKESRAMLYDFYVRGLSEKELREQQGADTPDYAGSAWRTALYRMRQRLRKCVHERLGEAGEHGSLEVDQIFDPSEGSALASRSEALQAWLRDDPTAPDAVVHSLVERTAMRTALRQLDGAAAAAEVLQFPKPTGAAQRQSWRWLAVAAGLALAFGLWRLLSPADSALPYVVQTAGRISLSRAGTLLSPAAGRIQLQAGDVVRTGPGATASLRYSSEATTFELGENGELEFPPQPGRGKLLRLRMGGVHVTADRQPPGAPLAIETPSARVTVVGTRFTVRADAAGTAVDVQSGRVRLASLSREAKPGEVLELGPGASGEVGAAGGAPERHRRGTIARDVWFGINGEVHYRTLLRAPRYPDRPDLRGEIAQLEAPSNFGDFYGQRLHGWLHPPASGEYTFWIAGDNGCALWLSADDQPAHRRLVAAVEDFTLPREWDKYPAQRSAKIRLEAGRRYFLEVVHFEQAHEDHVAVAWEGPDIPRQVIPGAFLSPR